uniref:Acetylglutamate kinase n=1 Tax=Kuetzingia canaliculata TaxID=228262 RepID=A0A1Z1MPD8_KUECA|nr:acetylglutamate kinase [Kuetzingia canaliculata]ARW67950.1 acetylglutamate kinase [Kuetzingia canaliculata]
MSNFIVHDRFYFSSDTISLVNKYNGSTFVVKYGGSVMNSDTLKCQIIEDLCLLYFFGINIILVHGGGILINHWLSKFGIKPKFLDGVRVTDYDTMKVVEMVLSGQVNKDLVALFDQHNIFSVGLSGKDAGLIRASHLFSSTENFTGKIDNINTRVLHLLLSNRCIPVIASIGSDSNGKTYNVNADTAASAIASAVQAEKLILLTDAPGVLRDINDESSLIKDLNLQTIQELRLNNIISAGMIPKIQSCVDALHSNVKSVHIIDGRMKHSLLREVLTSTRIGSMVVL